MADHAHTTALRAMKSEGLALSRAEAHQMQICDPKGMTLSLEPQLKQSYTK